MDIVFDRTDTSVYFWYIIEEVPNYDRKKPLENSIDNNVFSFCASKCKRARNES